MSDNPKLKVSEVQLVYKSKIKPADRPSVRCSRDAYNILKSNWSDQLNLQEEFNILLLNRANRVLGMCHISKGGMASTIVDLKLVFATAIKGAATGIILSHNHPSGNLQPSPSDIKLTEKFKQAGEILDIEILDHLILSPDDAYYSFADEATL